MTTIRLTSLAPCAGCAAKMGPKALAQVLRPLAGLFAAEEHPELLAGLESPDDALVWKLDDERALVQTADFFTPVVDDPYAFGAIAAANALSDIYAMGATPLFALNIVGFPDTVDPKVLAEILRGGAEKVKEAGAVIAGGHTVTDSEPKYGLAVTGIVHPARILTKGGALPGDVLLLTKPIGTGIVTTAAQRDKATPEQLEAAVASMTRLSATASRILVESYPAVHALTDITGFSLMGHAHEMAHLSGCALRFDWDALPLLPGALDLARAGIATGGGQRNLDHYGDFVEYKRSSEMWELGVLFDPQTSGPLLAAVDPREASKVADRLRSRGEPAWVVGEALEGNAGTIVLT
jgi:selenide,water dikinase